MLLHAHGDFETRSRAPLKFTGTYKYARDVSTEPLCFAWCIGDNEPELWLPNAPGRVHILFEHVVNGGVFVAHNAAFELDIWNQLMVPRYGWPALPIPQVRCTMAQAFALGLPGALEKLALVLGVSEQKHAEGARQMKRLVVPRRQHTPGSRSHTKLLRDAEAGKIDLQNRVEFTHCADGTIIQWWCEPERLTQLGRYCCQDVRTERAVESYMLPLQPREQALWWLDRVINLRGFQIDRDLINGMLAIVASEVRRLDARVAELTGGAVKSARQVKPLAEWLSSELRQPVVKLAKADVLALLALPGLSDRTREALEIRQQVAKSSTSKLTAALQSADDDDRIRNSIQYHAANTGRFGGRRFQPHNMPRPDARLKKADIQLAVDKILAHSAFASYDSELLEIEDDAA